MTKTLIKTDSFELYETSGGKKYLWVESDGCNYAYGKKPTEQILVEAIDLLIYSRQLQNTARAKAEGKLRKLEEAVSALAEPNWDGETPEISFF